MPDDPSPPSRSERDLPPRRPDPLPHRARVLDLGAGVSAPTHAPFPWFGGKSFAAPEIRALLGDGLSSYVEPFAGSLAVPLTGGPIAKVETVNDADGLLANVWRSIRWSPEATAQAADWPVSEADLSARHLWLIGRREEITRKIQTDPEWHDPKAAGWWIWGACCWIGSGWCSGDGPWTAGDDGAWVRDAGQGVHRKLPRLGNAGQGIHRHLPRLGNTGQGIHRQLPHLSPGQGIHRQFNAGREGALVAWFTTLATRLERVRIACGDWSRVVTPAAADPLGDGRVGVLLDPPYPDAWDADGAYAGGTSDAWHEAAAWAITAPPSWRIVLCGYEGMWTPPNGWVTVPVSSNGGYQKVSRNGTERLWCSPACVVRQGQLF